MYTVNNSDCRGSVARATREIITALRGVASVSVAKQPGLKQFMAEEYLFSERHAGFHTPSSMKYSLNCRAGDLQHFLDLMCGQANLTCRVECLTSVCCVWHIHLENGQDPAGSFDMSAETEWKHVLDKPTASVHWPRYEVRCATAPVHVCRANTLVMDEEYCAWIMTLLQLQTTR